MGPPATHVAVGASEPTSAKTGPGLASGPARPPPALLVPRVTCPRCRVRPRIRITQALAGACIGLPAGELLLTHRCRCGEVYCIRAADFGEPSFVKEGCGGGRESI